MGCGSLCSISNVYIRPSLSEEACQVEQREANRRKTAIGIGSALIAPPASVGRNRRYRV